MHKAFLNGNEKSRPLKVYVTFALQGHYNNRYDMHLATRKVIEKPIFQSSWEKTADIYEISNSVLLD